MRSDEIKIDQDYRVEFFGIRTATVIEKGLRTKGRSRRPAVAIRLHEAIDNRDVLPESHYAAGEIVTISLVQIKEAA